MSGRAAGAATCCARRCLTGACSCVRALAAGAPALDEPCACPVSAAGYTFPYLYDETQDIAKAYKVSAMAWWQWRRPPATAHTGNAARVDSRVQCLASLPVAIDQLGAVQSYLPHSTTLRPLEQHSRQNRAAETTLPGRAPPPRRWRAPRSSLCLTRAWAWPTTAPLTAARRATRCPSPVRGRFQTPLACVRACARARPGGLAGAAAALAAPLLSAAGRCFCQSSG